MSADRKAIRTAIAAKLVAAATKAGSNVFTNRSEALNHARTGGELPAIVIYTRSEDAEKSGEAPREYKRTVSVGIELLTPDGGQLVDDEVDDFAQQVEAALFPDPTLGGAAADGAMLQEVEVETSSKGYELLGACRLTWGYVYYVTWPEGTHPVTDLFSKAFVDYDFVPVDATPEASDQITLP